jgi:hypothetical protein
VLGLGRYRIYLTIRGLKTGGVDVGAHYRQQCLRTAVWPILQHICAYAGGARNRWDRLFLYRFESAKWFKETAPARGLGELRPPCRGVPWGERHASDVGLAIRRRH